MTTPQDWDEVDPERLASVPADMIANAPEDDLPPASAGAFAADTNEEADPLTVDPVGAPAVSSFVDEDGGLDG